MAKVANNMSGISDKDASSKAAKAVTNCSGIQLASIAPPEVSELDTAQKELDTAVANQAVTAQADKAATQVKYQKRTILDAKYATLGGKVQTISGGDPSVIVARGFDVASSTHTPVSAGPVSNLIVTPGANEGQLHWKVTADAGMIILLQTSPDVNPRVWTNQEPTSKHNGTIGGLPSLTRHWVRIAEKGNHGTGPWSDPGLGNVP